MLTDFKILFADERHATFATNMALIVNITAFSAVKEF